MTEFQPVLMTPIARTKTVPQQPEERQTGHFAFAFVNAGGGDEELLAAYFRIVACHPARGVRSYASGCQCTGDQNGPGAPAGVAAQARRQATAGASIRSR